MASNFVVRRTNGNFSEIKWRKGEKVEEKEESIDEKQAALWSLQFSWLNFLLLTSFFKRVQKPVSVAMIFGICLCLSLTADYLKINFCFSHSLFVTPNWSVYSVHVSFFFHLPVYLFSLNYLFPFVGLSENRRGIQRLREKEKSQER